MVLSGKRLKLVSFTESDQCVLWPVMKPPEDLRIPDHLRSKPCTKLISGAQVAWEKDKVLRYRMIVTVREDDTLLVLDEASKNLATQFEETFGKQAPITYYYFGPLVSESREEWTGSSYERKSHFHGSKDILLRAGISFLRWLEKRDIRVFPILPENNDLHWLSRSERETFQVAIAYPATPISLTTDNGTFTGTGGLILDKRGELFALISTQHLPDGNLDAIGEFQSISGTCEDGFSFTTDVGAVEAMTRFSGCQAGKNGRIRIALGSVRMMTNAESTGAFDEMIVDLTNVKVVGIGEGRFSDGRFQVERIRGVPWNSQLPTERALRITFCPGSNGSGSASTEQLIQHLISVAMRARCSIAYIEWRNKSIAIAREVRAILPSPSIFRPMVSHRASDLADFIVRCELGYKGSSQNYDLPVLIDYYLRAHSEAFLEMKIIVASVFMESFKFMWAKRQPSLIQNLKSNGLIREFREQNSRGNEARLSFEQLLTRAAASIGIQNPTYSFIDNRNCLFHTGVSAQAQLGSAGVISILEREYDILADQVDDVLLSLLSFRGEIYRFSDPDTLVTFP